LEAGLESPTPVTYNIKIGGTDKSLQTGTLTISGSPATVTIVIGDVSGDGKVNSTDLTQLGRKVKGKTTNVGKVGDVKTKPNDGGTVTVGDTNLDSKVNSTDLTQLGRKVKGKTTNVGNVGVEVEVLDESAE
jgi:hypothetical protein